MAWNRNEGNSKWLELHFRIRQVTENTDLCSKLSHTSGLSHQSTNVKIVFTRGNTILQPAVPISYYCIDKEYWSVSKKCSGILGKDSDIEENVLESCWRVLKIFRIINFCNIINIIAGENTENMCKSPGCSFVCIFWVVIFSSKTLVSVCTIK